MHFNKSMIDIQYQMEIFWLHPILREKARTVTALVTWYTHYHTISTCVFFDSLGNIWVHVLLGHMYLYAVFNMWYLYGLSNSQVGQMADLKRSVPPHHDMCLWSLLHNGSFFKPYLPTAKPSVASHARIAIISYQFDCSGNLLKWNFDGSIAFTCVESSRSPN